MTNLIVDIEKHNMNKDQYSFEIDPIFEKNSLCFDKNYTSGFLLNQLCINKHLGIELDGSEDHFFN